MAIYHLSVKPVSRGDGRSATAAAAYRAGEKIHDQATDQTFDYTRKRGVEHAEIVLPTAAAKRDIHWARDRQALWNAAEGAENRSNSRVAREYELALPHELDRGQRQALVRAFSQGVADRYGVAVDFAIHAPHRQGDERNHHAHVLTTTRVIETDGLGEKAAIEWSDANRRKAGLGPAKQEIGAVREAWATLTNEFLQERGLAARIDHRSLEHQGIAREATSHLGPAVSQMERRGIATQVGKRLQGEMKAAAQELEKGASDHKALEREQGILRPRPSLEEQRRQGREKWLAMRAAELEEKGSLPSLQEQQRQAAERWKEYRRQALEHEKARGSQEKREDKGLEDSQKERRRDHDHGDEFEM